MAALVAVHNRWCPVFGDAPLRHCDVKVSIHNTRELSRLDLAARSIHDRYQVQKTSFYRNVSDVNCPHSAGPLNQQISRQIWIELISRMRLAGTGLTADEANMPILSSAVGLSSSKTLTAPLGNSATQAETCVLWANSTRVPPLSASGATLP